MNIHTHLFGFRTGEARMIRFAQSETPREEAPQPDTHVEKISTPDQVREAADTRVAKADESVVSRFQQLQAQEKGLRAVGSTAEGLKDLTGGLRDVLKRINQGANEAGFDANGKPLTRMVAGTVEDISQQASDALGTYVEKPLGDVAVSANERAADAGGNMRDMRNAEKQKMDQAAANLNAMGAAPEPGADLPGAHTPLEITHEPAAIPVLKPMPAINPIAPVETPDLTKQAPAAAVETPAAERSQTAEEAKAMLDKNLNKNTTETPAAQRPQTAEEAKAMLDKNLNKNAADVPAAAPDEHQERATGNEQMTDELTDIVHNMENAKGLEQLKYLLEAIAKLLEQLTNSLTGTTPEAKKEGGADAPAPEAGTETVAEQLGKRAQEKKNEDPAANIEELKKEKQQKLEGNAEQIGTLDKDIKGLKDKNNALIGERSALEQKMNALRGDETSAAQMKSLQAQIDALTTQIDANNKAIDSIDAQRDALPVQEKKIREDIKMLDSMRTGVLKASETIRTIMQSLPEGNRPGVTMTITPEGRVSVILKGVDASVQLPEGAVRDPDGTVRVQPAARMAQIRNNVTEHAEKPAEKMTEADLNALIVRAEGDLAELTNMIGFQGGGVSVDQRLAAMNAYLGNVHTRLPDGHQLAELRLHRVMKSQADGREYSVDYNTQNGRLEVSAKGEPANGQSPQQKAQIV